MTATDNAESHSLLIQDIGTLAVVPPGPVPGRRMADVPLLREAGVLVRDGRIAWFGPASQAPLDEGTHTISAGGGLVMPGLIDPHTHIPFAGDRSAEFVRRVRGESYLSIMQAGGGIRVTSQAVRAASVDDLVQANLPRLRRMLANGVTRVECKSGYGLLPEHEIKQLEAIAALARMQPISLEPTYLGLHAVPPEYEGRADEFVELASSESLLRDLADRRLARFCDVFCDRGAFSVAQARLVLERAARVGLRAKLHADELAAIGASRLAGELHAVSADHLEHIDDAGIAAMAATGTVALVLPGTSFFLGIPHVDARRLIAAGLPVAIGTDFNPGSCMIESLPWIMSVACCQLRLLPAEVLVACTANAAAALDVHEQAGAIAVGFDADLTVVDAAGLDDWFYQAGRPRVRAVVKGGRVVYRKAEHGN